MLSGDKQIEVTGTLEAFHATSDGVFLFFYGRLCASGEEEVSRILGEQGLV